MIFRKYSKLTFICLAVAFVAFIPGFGEAFGRSVSKKPYSKSNIRFTVNVNVNNLKNTPSSPELVDEITEYQDYGVLMLPESYSPVGKPTRLVIGCHGAGGGSTDHDSQTESYTVYKYLCANGYAVMDMNGLPSAWVDANIDKFYSDDDRGFLSANNVGCPMAIECYIKGYQWVIDNYNICKDGVFVCGASMGGLSSTNLVLSGAIPVIAHALYAPVLDLYNQAFTHPWTRGLSKFAVAKIYGFNGDDESNSYAWDADKVRGYNPIVNGMQSYTDDGKRVSSEGVFDFSGHTLNGMNVVEYKSYPCALKIWHCEDDSVVSISVSERQVDAIRNAGGVAWIRKIPTGDHSPDTAGNAIAAPSGNTILKGESVGTIYPLQEETLLFFSRFSNINLK